MSEPIGTKYCPRCKRILTLSEFSKCSRDGLQNYCKNCARQYRQTEKYKQIKKRYFQTDKGKQARKRYDKNNPKKKKARDEISSAIRAGKLLSAHHYWCACGKQAEQYHHESYEPDQWLVVVPLCRLCHGKTWRVR